MKERIKIFQESYGSIQIIKVKGFMDIMAVSSFQQLLDKLILQQNHQIILDFTELEYISSAGLGTIIGRIRELRKNGGDVKLGGCSPRVLDILNVFGFTDVFDVCENVEAAIEKFKE